MERYEELNVDVDINQLLIKQYAYDYHDYPKKDAFCYQRADNKTTDCNPSVLRLSKIDGKHW